MQSEEVESWGKWRSFFWPIHRQELKKFLPMFGIFFLISFNYNILRSYKDTLVVTANEAGAEVLPFIKVWAVLPSAILLTLLFTRLSNWFSRERVFYTMMALFLCFFLLFAFVLYPFQEFLSPTRFADSCAAVLPRGCKGLIAILRNWPLTLFYVMSELWSTSIFSVLFWGFANEVTTVQEAKRFYGLLATGGNIAGIFAGQTAIFFSGNLFIPSIPYGKTAWDQSILFLTLALVGAGGVAIALFRWLHHHVIAPSERLRVASHPEQPRVKMSMRENFRYLARSKYLVYIALIVLTYNIGMNLVEVVWKHEIKLLYPHPSDYNAYMGKVMIIMAIIATSVGLLTTTNIIRRFSWTAAASVPLAIVTVTGALFFATVIFQEFNGAWMGALIGVSPAFLGVTLGSIQNCCSRAAKYTLFDATKEIAFIPLSAESKLKGKAAIDGVGSRLGKSGGSLIHQTLLVFFSTLGASVPYVAIIFLGIMCIWALSIHSLGKQFDELVAHNAKLDIPDTPSPVLAERPVS
jgi:AAA family ATP:ADP antiporter